MDKMPSVSILKDAASNIEKPEEKKARRVQFTNPIVSDEVSFGEKEKKNYNLDF